ncbi:MAG TPA: hypothetical protein VGK20_18755 [Candidatus Binatia bacterium]
MACTGVGACGPSGGGTTYTIVFSLGDNAPDVDSVHFTATYEGGNILGSGATAECTAADSVTVTVVDFDSPALDGPKFLDVQAGAKDTAISAGDEIMTCSFTAGTQPTSHNFAMTTTAATDDNDDSISDLSNVDVVVSSTCLASGTTSGSCPQ